MAQTPATRVGVVAGALSLVGYLATLCPTVYVEGSGELIGAAYRLGTPHPTGYPLYCLLGRVCTMLLPFGSPAHQINLFTALTAAGAVGLLAALLRQRGMSSAAALAAGLAFAFSATFWSQAVIAEVYGMAMAGAVVLLWVGLRSVESGRLGPWLALAYFAGLGVALHLSLALFWPALALLHWRHQRQLWRAGQALLLALPVAALGFSPVVYLWVRNGAGDAFHWGVIVSAAQWWAHLNGELYRDSFFSLPAAAMWRNLLRLGEQLFREFHPLLAPLLAWGAWVGYRRDPRLWLVVGGGVAANLLVALNYHRDPNGIGVFFLVSILGAAVFLGWGVEGLAGCSWWGGAARRKAALSALAAAVAGLVFAGQYAGADRSRVALAHQYGADLLGGLPPGAVLFTEGDDAAFIVDYLQRLEGVRPDVSVFNRMGRGRDLLARSEAALGAGDQARLRAQREAQLIREGSRPVFYLYPRRLPVEGFRLVPAGLAYRVWPQEATPVPGGVPPLPDQAENRDPWVRKLQANYAFMEGERNLALGDTSAGVEAYRRAAQIAHDSRSTRFNVALMLLRTNRLAEALREAEIARELDPWNPEVHRLLGQIRARQAQGGMGEILHKKTGETAAPP